MLTNEQITAQIENTFKPLTCVAEIWDYGRRIRFKVFDSNDSGILEIPDLILVNIRDESQLRSVLSAARESIEERGFVLDDWS